MATQLPMVATRGGPAGPSSLPQRTTTRPSRGALQCCAYQRTLPSVRRSAPASDNRVKASVDGEAVSSEALRSYYQEEESAAIALPRRRTTASVLNAIVDTVAVTPYNWYCNSLRRHPLTTKACTSLVSELGLFGARGCKLAALWHALPQCTAQEIDFVATQ